MEKNTGISEFLAYLNSLEIPDFLNSEVDRKGNTLGYRIKYRSCGFCGTSEERIYCLAVKFLNSGVVELECKFADGWNGLEFKCN